jgi:hypothetical protein
MFTNPKPMAPVQMARITMFSIMLKLLCQLKSPCQKWLKYIYSGRASFEPMIQAGKAVFTCQTLQMGIFLRTFRFLPISLPRNFIKIKATDTGQMIVTSIVRFDLKLLVNEISMPGSRL